MTTETSRESSNGSGPEASARAAGGAASAPSSLARIAGRVIGAVAQEAQRRVPSADLDERDPDYIRETLPGLWMLASLYFRADVRGLQNIRRRPRATRGQTIPAATSRLTRTFSRWRSALLRGRAPLPSAGAQTSCCRCTGSGCCASTAPGRHARERGTGARHQALRCSSTRRRLRGQPPTLGVRRRVASTAARSPSGWRKSKGVRSFRWSRSAARRRALFSRAARGIARLLGIDRMFG